MKDICVYTRAKCHHKGCKCSECPLTDLICDEFDECLDLSYEQGRHDMEKELNALGECEYKKGRADAIDKAIDFIADAIEELGCADATKYGNRDAKQQANSYSTVMKYEICDVLEDVIDNLEQLKE